MAFNSKQLRDLVTEYVSVLTNLSKKGHNALQENFEQINESGASTSECNTMMYEMVKERLISDGKINDSMSETQIDWIIFTDTIVRKSITLALYVYQKPVIYGPMKWKDVTYVKLLEFPRFVGFNIRTNKRCLLTWMELFKVLLDIETKRMRGERGKNKKRTSFESSKFIQQCQSIIETCNIFNDKDVLKRPEFQVVLTHIIFNHIYECDPRTDSPTYKTSNLEKIWDDRILHLGFAWLDEGFDLSLSAVNLLTLLNEKSPKESFLSTYCSFPLTEDEEKYLLVMRLNFEEKRNSIYNAWHSKNTPKVKRGIKARAAREAAAKEKHRERERRRKRKMWHLMHDALSNIFKASSKEVTFTTFTNIAHHVFKSMHRRKIPAKGPLSFKDWQNIDLLIQLIKAESIPELTKDKLTFQLNKTMLCNTEALNKAPVKETIELSKGEALDALRKLRNKLRRDPEYFSSL